LEKRMGKGAVPRSVKITHWGWMPSHVRPSCVSSSGQRHLLVYYQLIKHRVVTSW
jgi:hypothetical protein